MTQSHSEITADQKSKTTILVVDDEQIIRELCSQALREYRVLQAGTCAEAIHLYEKESIDLILSDVMMPGGSGIELLRQIKALDPNAAVVIMTGFAGTEVILEALKEDADDFINKPLNLLQLRTSVKKALAKKALKEELANLRHADHLKSGFLSLISHKLRTPITAISLFLHDMQRGIYEPNDPAFRQNMALVSEEASYLARLVSDLLAFSQVMVGNDGIQRRPCDLNLLASDRLIQSRELQGKRAIEIEFCPGTLPLLNLDHAKIGFVLQQVIDNAFKFSGDVGRVSLRTLASSDEVIIIVSDSGIGIPHDEIPKLFEKFYQIDPENTGQVRGFGLGLFYVRDFVRQHGGSISLDSEPGLGTTVTISLPMQ
ncbi:MAG: ATP-binding protein [Desulfuromonadales bacterium]